MPIFRINDKIIYFCHFPKCGGTSIENALVDQGVELGFINAAWWREKHHLWYKSSPQHISERDRQTLIPDTLIDYSFAVIRDPVSRFISAFNHNRRARRISFFSTIDSFLSKIEKRNDFYGYQMDNHFLPAHYFVKNDSEVFKLEDGLDSVVRRLEVISDGALSISVKHENIRSLNDATSQTVLRRLVKTYLMPRIPPKNEMSPELLERIRNLYREDYERFQL